MTATQISQGQKKVTLLQSEWVDATFPEEPIIFILHEYEKSILRKKERDNNNANFPTCPPIVVANELSVGEGSQLQNRKNNCLNWSCSKIKRVKYKTKHDLKNIFYK